MRVLVAGGFGFIGGRIAKFLDQTGHQVFLGTHRDLVNPDWLPKANTVKMNWNDVAELELCCKNMDVVIHAAGMNSRECELSPKKAFQINGKATSHLILAASNVGVGKFLYFSTAHVYANPLKGFLSEDLYPTNLHPYATSHLIGETAVLNANFLGKVRAVVLRVSNAFGMPAHPDVQCWSLLVNSLCKEAVAFKTMTLTSSGEQKRDFITMDDVVHATSHLINESSTMGVFNVGSGSTLKVIDMVKIIQLRCVHLFGFKPEINIGTKREPKPFFKFDISKIVNTGFKFNKNFIKEIDDLLVMCSADFHNSGDR